MVISALLHKNSKSKELVCIATTPAEATLTLTQVVLSPWLELIQDDSGEDLAWNAQKSYPTIVVTHSTATFLMHRDQYLSSPICWNLFLPPDDIKKSFHPTN